MTPSPSTPAGVTALLPCPFCGSEPVEAHTTGIFCNNEDCNLDGVVFPDIGDWNTRAPSNSHEALVDAATCVLAGLNARIDAADPKSVPVFDGVAELHAALASVKP